LRPSGIRSRREIRWLPTCGWCYLHTAIFLLAVLIDNQLQLANLRLDLPSKSDPPHDGVEGPGSADILSYSCAALASAGSIRRRHSRIKSAVSTTVRLMGALVLELGRRGVSLMHSTRGHCLFAGVLHRTATEAGKRVCRRRHLVGFSCRSGDWRRWRYFALRNIGPIGDSAMER
jgi:hypothetical protein